MRKCATPRCDMAASDVCIHCDLCYRIEERAGMLEDSQGLDTVRAGLAAKMMERAR